MASSECGPLPYDPPCMSQGSTAHPFEDPKRPHLEPAELELFLRGELGRAETRRVVRHLLTRCPQCVAVAQPLWGASPW